MEKKLYCGGTILTMDPSQRGDALLVEDGRIRGIGPEAELKGQAAGAEEIRLEGRTLMPAFIDPHSHFSACANALLQGTVERAESFADIVDTIRAYIRERQIPAGSWVAVRDLDPEVLREGRVPDKGVLDLASQDHPIILQHKSGHVGVLNSLALKMAGIGADTPDPSGGKIWREDGEPTGYLEENAFIPVLHRLPPPSWEELEAAYGKAQEMYASYGIATVQEGFMSEEMIPVYRGLCGGGKLQLDVVGYPGAEGGEKLFQALPEYAGDYREHFRLGGYKMFLDGSPQSRTAWVRTPYLGSEDRGYPTLTDRQVYGYAERAVKEGRQILAHCNGDAAAEQYLAALEQVKAGGLDPAAVRPVMIHAQLLGLDQIPRLASLGVIPSFFVAHVYHWGDTHIRNFGRERAGRISPARSAWEAGLPFTFHQDAPVIRPDMAETLWCAVCRRTRSGQLLGEEERIPVEEALKAVTIHGAYQYGEEREKGSLTPGKKADLVILDRNPMEAAPEELREIRVLETIKEGKTVFSRKGQK